MKKCPKCYAKHDKPGRFCSRKCANSRIRTEEIKNKISKSVKKWAENNPPPTKGKTTKIQRTCLICDNAFIVYPKSKKVYCSFKCNPNVGGYRPGSGRSKSGYYKGIYCGSTYELAWVIYQLDHEIYFQRFQGCLVHNDLKYFPDFLQGNTIIEIKGYEDKKYVDAKSQVARYYGYDVVVLRKEDLTKEFEWVKVTYGKELYTLYDGYKPEYEYTCCLCNKLYKTDKKKKTSQGFCSRRCSILGNRKKKKSKSHSRLNELGCLTFTQEDAGLSPVCDANLKELYNGYQSR